MPKPYTFPILLDEVKTIQIKDLKSWGYLKPLNEQEGTLRWYRNEIETSSIRIKVKLINGKGLLFLKYTSQGESISYAVGIKSIPSNLGKGKVWLFICPVVKKRCRKLYLVGNYFLHREAFPNAMYSSQTYSKQSRAQITPLKTMFKLDQLIQEGTQIRECYNGKLTKRFRKIQNLRRAIIRDSSNFR